MTPYRKGGAAGRREIIEMFAMRKSDKQVRDKEGIPRISGQDSEVTGDAAAVPPRGRCGAANEAFYALEREARAVGVSLNRTEDITTIHNEEFDPGSG